MFSLIPLPWKIGLVAAFLAVLAGSSWVAGRKSLRGEMDALRRSYELAAAQAAGREAERGRIWKQASIVAGEKYVEKITAGNTWADSQFKRMRDASATRDRVRDATAAPAGCPATRGPGQAELLAASRTVIEIARDANQDRAGLIACLEAWPR